MTSLRNKIFVIVWPVILVSGTVLYAVWRFLLSPRLQAEAPGVASESAGELYLLISFFCLGILASVVTALQLKKHFVAPLDRMIGEMSPAGGRGDRRLSTSDMPERFSQLAMQINNLLSSAQQSQKKDQTENVELRKNIVVLRTLAEIDREITAKSEPKTIVELVCRRAPKLLDVPMAAIFLDDEQERPAAASGLEFPRNFAVRQGVGFQTFAGRGTAHGHGAYTFSGGEIDDLFEAGCRRGENIQAAAAALLGVEGHVFGALLILDRAPRVWRGDEIQFLRLLASQVALALDAARLLKDESARREELASLYELSRTIADVNPDTDSILTLVAQHAVDKVHVTFSVAALIEDEQLVIHSAHPIRRISRNLFDSIVEPATFSFLKNILKEDRITVLHRNDTSLPETVKHELFLDMVQVLCLAPLRTEKGLRGMLIFGEERSEEREPFSEEKKRLAQNIRDQTLSALRRAELFKELENAYLETVLALANAVDAKDTYTGDHGRRLSDMALAIGTRLDMTPAQLNELKYGAILHDVGKIGIPDAILQKPGKLNDEEWHFIQRHAVMGEEILAPVSSLMGAAGMIRHHHEWYNGNGYPDGLAGPEIPLGSRILTVVDSFCAITDKRSYKEARPLKEALDEMRRCAGSQFDPQIVDLLTNIIKEGGIDFLVAA